mgnify:CR=1 FL=1
MLFAHPSIDAEPGRHIALVSGAALSAPAILGRLVAGAAIDILEFSSSFEACCPEHRSHEIVAHLRTWLQASAQDNPFVTLQIMHVNDALAAADIDPRGHFSTEVAASDRYGNNHCREDQEKWFAWIKRANAVHRCNWWDDEKAILEDICDVIEMKASILVLERIG